MSRSQPHTKPATATESRHSSRRLPIGSEEARMVLARWAIGSPCSRSGVTGASTVSVDVPHALVYADQVRSHVQESLASSRSFLIAHRRGGHDPAWRAAVLIWDVCSLPASRLELC